MQTEKSKLDISRLEERRNELENIDQLTAKILELSKDMKETVYKQGSSICMLNFLFKIASIDDYIQDTRVNLKEGETETAITRNRETSKLRTSFWVGILAGLVICILLFYYYVFN